MATGLSYADYLSFGRRNLAHQEGEGGPMVFQPMSEAEWNALSPEQRYQTMSGQYLANNAWGSGGGALDSESDMARRYAQANGRQTPTEVYYTSTKPTEGIANPAAVWQDPDSGMWVVPQDAIDPEWRNRLEAADNTGLFRGEPWQNILTGAGIVLGGAGLDSLLTGGLGNAGTVGANVGLDAFEAGSFLPGGAPEAGMALNYTGAGAAATSPFDSWLESYISDSGSTTQLPFGAEDIADLGIDTGAAATARELGVYGNAFDASPSIWDTLSNFGSGLVDKLPAIANAAQLFREPGMPTRPTASGGGGGGGLMGGGGGGGLGGRGSEFDPMKMKQVLTLAEYLGGRK